MPTARIALIVALSLAPLSRAVIVELPPLDRPLAFGETAIAVPDPGRKNETTARTAALLAAELARAGVPRERRAELATDLGETGRAEAAAPLAQAAGDADAVVRAAAARALGRLADPAGADAVRALAADADPAVRAEAARAAAALGLNDLVTAALADADAGVVAAALSVAGPAQAAAVAGMLGSGDDARQARALDALGRVGAPAAAAAGNVAGLLSTGSVPVRVAAVRALGAMRATGNAAAVVERLSDDHASVRRAATAALPDVLPADDARRRAIGMLADVDPSVRAAAALALARVPGPAAVDPLAAALADPHRPLHAAARAALVAVGPPAAPAAGRLLEHADARRREDGSYVLGRLASGENFARHVALLDDADWGVAAQAAQSLGLVADPAAAGPLMRTIDRALAAKPPAGEPSVVAQPYVAAVNAFVSAAQLGHAPVGPKAAAVIPDKSAGTTVRAAAIWAFGVVGGPNEDRVFGRFPSYIGDIMEGGDVKLEAAKAVGNRRYAKGGPTLDTAEQQLGGGIGAAVVHWSRDRLRGAATPFDLPPVEWRADVSISDVPQ